LRLARGNVSQSLTSLPLELARPAAAPSLFPALLRLDITRVYLATGVAVFLFLAFVFMGRLGLTVVDDAYIALIYARNLARGDGLTYTDGVRVEGYTDFLWVLLGAGAFKLEVDPILAYRAVGLVSGVFIVFGVWYWSRRFSTAPTHLRLAPVLVGAMGPIAFWAVAGLETTFFAALAFGGTLLASIGGGRRLALSGSLFFLAALTHPDAVILLVPVVLMTAFSNSGDRWRHAAILLVTFGIPFAVYWALRWSYFGDFLPNTALAKSSASPFQVLRGAAYIVMYSPFTVPLVACMFFAAFRPRHSHPPATRLLVWQLLLWLGYLLYVGGDFMVMVRFMVPILPGSALLMQECVWTIARTSRRQRTWLAVGSATVLATALSWAWSPSLPRYSGGETQPERNELGRWLNANTAPDVVVAVSAAGGTPFFADRPAVDMLGLNDRHIARSKVYDHVAAQAHKKTDASYVFSRRPDFIVLNLIREQGQVIGAQEASLLVSNKALLELPALWEEYTRIRIPALEGHPVLLLRNDRLSHYIAAGLAVPVQVDSQPALSGHR
jgi:arabinofuranosyltransferase